MQRRGGQPTLRRVLLLTLCLCLLALSAATVFGRALGRADDARALHIRDCDDKPCLFGIIPGATAWADAASVLSSYPLDEMSDQRIFVALPGASVETYVSVNRRTVGRIYLSFRREAPLSAAWVIQRYGAPCGVSLYGGGDLLTLRYPLLLVNVRVSDGEFDPNTPVAMIRFSDPDFVFESQPDPCVDNITTRQTLNTHWQGFVPPAIYWQRSR